VLQHRTLGRHPTPPSPGAGAGPGLLVAGPEVGLDLVVGHGGGQAAAKKLRRANVLSCGIGLPIAPVDGDLNGLRMGTPEIVRWGMNSGDMPELAGFIARALIGNAEPEAVAPAVTVFRRRFSKLHFIRA